MSAKELCPKCHSVNPIGSYACHGCGNGFHLWDDRSVSKIQSALEQAQEKIKELEEDSNKLADALAYALSYCVDYVGDANEVLYNFKKSEVRMKLLKILVNWIVILTILPFTFFVLLICLIIKSILDIIKDLKTDISERGLRKDILLGEHWFWEDDGK